MRPGLGSCEKISSMGAGWVCRVLSGAGNIELEQLDDAGRDWFAVGPSGEHIGALEEILTAAVGGLVDPNWFAVAVATVKRDSTSERRSMLLVKRAAGTWFHTTFAENRASISRHGLDWTRMTNTGIAGSREPEAEGVFLCSNIESAEWFAQMGWRRGAPGGHLGRRPRRGVVGRRSRRKWRRRRRLDDLHRINRAHATHARAQRPAAIQPWMKLRAESVATRS